ncbi:hypothetical protein M8J76_005910 [Diaphorina citri]|nr:hypothetical protein M8J76_005910 [Diaphorina citri]
MIVQFVHFLSSIFCYNMAAMGTLPGNIKVKQEKQDDPEIMEMAAKIAEANRMKLAQTTAQAAQPPRTLNGAPNLRGFIVATSTVNGATVLKTPGTVTPATPAPAENEAIDEPSTKGKFSWTVVGVSSVPVILRRDGKYISVRIMEMKVLSTHLNFLHPDIYLQARVPSYEMTEAEHRLLNEINVRHCESKFGRESFSSKDLVVKLKDAIDFFMFLDVCYHKLQNGSSTFGNDKCGFIRINKDSVIPYTVKDGERYVPIFYFEGETDKLKTKSVELTGWELAYLKFCCKVQGIKNELFNNETCGVTSLNDIKSYFSASDVFEEYWPNKVVDSQLLISATKHGVTGSNSWIRTPPPGPNSHKTNPRPGGVIAINGVPANWNGATVPARAPNNVQQQLVAAATRNAAVAAAAAGNRASSSVANVRSMVPQYYTSPQLLSGGGVPSLVRTVGPGSRPPTSVANMNTAYAKVISNSYTNLTPAGTYKNGVWPSNYTAANSQQIQQMLASGQLPASYAYQTGSTPSNAKTDASGRNLAPPPLIPVMNNNAARTQQQIQQQSTPTDACGRNLAPPPLVPRTQQQRYYATGASSGGAKTASNAEIIDLSSPPNSPQRSTGASRQSGLVNGSRTSSLTAHHSSLASQMQSDLYLRYDRALVDSFQYIQEITTPSSTKPYRVSKTRVQSGILTCINRQPFMYNEDLMTTISDFISTLAPNVHPKRVIEAFNVLSIKLYVANRLQMETLTETKRYKNVYMIVPLISVVDIKEHIGAISYDCLDPWGSCEKSPWKGKEPEKAFPVIPRPVYEYGRETDVSRRSCDETKGIKPLVFPRGQSLFDPTTLSRSGPSQRGCDDSNPLKFVLERGQPLFDPPTLSSRSVYDRYVPPQRPSASILQGDYLPQRPSTSILQGEYLPDSVYETYHGPVFGLPRPEGLYGASDVTLSEYPLHDNYWSGVAQYW